MLREPKREKFWFSFSIDMNVTSCARRMNFPFGEWSNGDVDDCLDGENCDSSAKKIIISFKITKSFFYLLLLI